MSEYVACLYIDMKINLKLQHFLGSKDSQSNSNQQLSNEDSAEDKSPTLRNFRSRANSSSSVNTAISGSSVSSMISISSSRKSHWPFGK